MMTTILSITTVPVEAMDDTDVINMFVATVPITIVQRWSIAPGCKFWLKKLSTVTMGG
jgi:hypothetical protein